MYGHDLLAPCAVCPPWDPRWGTVLSENEVLLCAAHALDDLRNKQPSA